MERFFQQYPEFEIMSHSAPLSIFINSRLIRTRIEEWDQLSLNSDDEIMLIIPIAGG